MTFTALRELNAYAEFSEKARQSTKTETDVAVRRAEREQAESARYTYSEPVDTVTISEPARKASGSLLALRESAPALEFREWMRSSNIFSKDFERNLSGSLVNEAFSGSGISVGNNEEFGIKFDPSNAIVVSSKNAEKAKAIQDLMNSMPWGINWGLLLAKLPPM